MMVNEMQVNQPNSVTPQPTVKETVSPPRQQTDPIQNPVQVPNPEAFKKKSTDAASIDINQTREELHQAIEQTPNTSMIEHSESIPKPDNFLTALQSAELKATTTVEKTGLASAQQEYRDHKHDLQVLSKTERVSQPDIQRVSVNVDYSPLLSEDLKTDLQFFSAGLQAGQRDGQIESQLKAVFAPALHNLDKAGRSVFNTKTNIAKVNQETQQMAQNWIADLGSGSDLTLILQSKSHAELRVLVQKMVGDIKGYDNEDLEQLSKKKNQFIDAIVSGIESGFQSAPPSANPGQLADRLAGMQSKLAQVLEQNPDLRQDLTLRTHSQIKLKLGQVMGISNPLVLEALFKGAMQSIQNDVSPVMVTVNNIEVPATFQLNGKSYGEPKFLDAGGFANVFRYQDLETGKFVAVKISSIKVGKDPEELRNEELNEITAHKEILGTTGHANIIGFEGVLKTQTDQLIMVQEFADGGNLRGFMRQLNGLEEAGVISHEQRLLLGSAILKGVLQGAQHMESQGTFHFDLKLDNCLLGGDFEPKITDFGMSGVGSEKIMTAKSETADNPLFKSPERLASEKTMVEEAKATINDYIRENHGFFDPGLSPTKPKAPVDPSNPTPSEQQALAQHKIDLVKYEADLENFNKHKPEYDRLFAQYNSQGMGSQTLSTKADNWALGVLAIELLSGDAKSVDLFNQKFNFQTERKIKEFGQGEGTVLDAENSALGETPTTRLINALMKPKDDDRVNFTGALESSMMQDPRLDSPIMKDVLRFFKENGLPKAPKNEAEDAIFQVDMKTWKAQHQDTLAQMFAQL